MKKTCLFIILIITAVFLGALIGSGVADISLLKWLAYSKSLSLDNISIDLIIIQLSFGCSFSINVAQLILMLAAFFVYPKAAASFD